MDASAAPILVWFRRDLRVGDNPALAAAASSGRPIVPVFILDDETPGLRAPGGASRWWLHGALAALAADLDAAGSRLILRRGAADRVLDELIAETGATAVHWNRLYDAGGISRDTEIKSSLKDRGIAAESFNGSLLFEPWEIETKAGSWFKVYTRFWQACRAAGDPPPPIDTPRAMPAPGAWPECDDLEAWALLPQAPDWAAGFRDHWTPGAAGASARLKHFLSDSVESYADDRDFPATPATSGLSPHLAWGDIGPRQVWQTAMAEAPAGAGRETFLKELVWREFAHHVTFHQPDMATQPMDAKFRDFPWEPDDDLMAAWQQGRTGYPMVDAGMRELWATGTMHNRVRMVVASFLVKHLLQPWQAGEAWFWDTLVDADPASNPFNWQWVAGCGADAAPYFRIFNPTLQADKFDADGAYLRRWVPELTEGGYPDPIVDHKIARERALAAFKSLKRE
ncbi:MAG: deoxyribodipyrimidine photolyase [Rhodospirillaceae bacterium]|nr:deoxyribodipyrimidine photolyase [Rhodospirillaceae bacterium]